MKKGQSVIQNAVTLIIVVVAIIIVAIMSSATTPLINGLITLQNLTGGMAVVASHFNLIMIIVLSLIGLIYAFFIGGGNN